jgi:cell wall-associated NlpC family hydrolase
LTLSHVYRAKRAFIAAGLALTLAAVVAAPAGTRAGTYVTKRLTGPARTIVYSPTGTWLATLTDGARTVDLRGPSRTFDESTSSATVTTTVWVRILPKPFNGTVDTSWLSLALDDRTPDVLEAASQYTTGAPPRFDSSGFQFAGDADYGPLQADGTRSAGSDFNDYLGISWAYAGVSDKPEPNQLRSLDCSGFVRMVFGYRMGLPMTLSPDGSSSLPRRASDIASSAPGVVVIANSGVRPRSRSALQPGDLVFFDASVDDANQVDHVGIFLGRDTYGHDRFLSSRKFANGPTLGNLGGASVLDGTGLYAVSFRTARRI